MFSGEGRICTSGNSIELKNNNARCYNMSELVNSIVVILKIFLFFYETNKMIKTSYSVCDLV